jgi:hypothetical protein
MVLNFHYSWMCSISWHRIQVQLWIHYIRFRACYTWWEKRFVVFPWFPMHFTLIFCFSSIFLSYMYFSLGETTCYNQPDSGSFTRGKLIHSWCQGFNSWAKQGDNCNTITQRSLRGRGRGGTNVNNAANEQATRGRGRGTTTRKKRLVQLVFFLKRRQKICPINLLRRRECPVN